MSRSSRSGFARRVGSLAGVWWLAMACLSVPGGALAQDGCVNTLVARSNDDGIGGTGLSDDDGIGGTGLSDGDGIGGTGFGDDDGVGGTGVYGTITGLGSICVNGLRIRYERDVSVMIFGEPSRASRLGVGHVVWVVAERSEPAAASDSMPDPTGEARAEWVARSITAYNARVGRVDSVEPNRFSIDGESIIWLDAAALFARPGERGFEVGDWVAVSGLRRADGRLVASRVDRAVAQQSATPIELGWLLRDATLARFSIEGYIGTTAFDSLEVNAMAELSIDAGARVWLETVVEADEVVPRGVVQRDYPGDVGLDPDFDSEIRDGADLDNLSTIRHGRKSPTVGEGGTAREPDSRMRSLREIWAKPAFRLAPGGRVDSDPTVDVPIDPTPSVDTRIDVLIDAVPDIPIDIRPDSVIQVPIEIDSR